MSKNLIIGAGFSAAITNLLIGKKFKIIGTLSHKLLDNRKYSRRKSVECNKIFSNQSKSYGSLKFKLNNGIMHDRLVMGGNSGVWGGKINIKKIPKNLYHILKKKMIFKKLSFKDTGTISNIKNIHQLQNVNKKILSTSDLVKNIQPGYIDNFSIKNRKIYVDIFFSTKLKKKIIVEKLYLCVGSLQFLDLLYRSNFLKENDLIEFSEFKHEFIFRFWNKPFSNKLTTIRYSLSRGIGHLFGVQYFSRFLKILNFIPFFIDQNFYPQKIKYTLKIKNGELIEKKCSLPNYKFGRSIHYCNLKINGVNINKFLHRINKNIKGLGMSFIDQDKPGPISNEIILDIKKKI
tara:strand:+ start:3679 stop:4719 length:1041 start_codon:yes stop_codon:yes gene_type:complete